MADIPLEGDIEVQIKGFDGDGTGTIRGVSVNARNRLDAESIITSEDGKRVTVTTDGSKERLDVAANISSVSISGGRVASPVYESDGWNNNQTKISYTVPTGKVLYIQSLWGSHESDASGHTIAFRYNSVQFYWMNFGDDTTATFQKEYPSNNPRAFSAGVVITAYRIDGSSPESWSAGFDGYLEDA